MSKKLRLAGSVALLAFLAWRTDWGQIASAFAGLRAGWWVLALAVYAATQFVSSVRWRLLAGSLGFRQPLGRFVTFYYVGMFFNLVLPTSVGGDVVRAWYLDGGSGRKVSAFLSVFADRASGLLMLIAIAVIAAVFSPTGLPPRVTWTVAGIGVSAALGLLGLFVLTRYSGPDREAPRPCTQGRGVGVRGLTLLSAPHPRPLAPEYRGEGSLRGRLDRLLNFARQAQSALVPGPRLFLVTTLLSAVVQAANVIVLWLAGLALGIDVPASYYWVLAPVVTLMTLVPVGLNGMGVREWGMVLMLAPLGVESGPATALSLLWFLTFGVVSLAGAACYFLGQFPRFEVRPDDESFGRGSDQGRESQPPAAA